MPSSARQLWKPACIIPDIAMVVIRYWGDEETLIEKKGDGGYIYDFD